MKILFNAVTKTYRTALLAALCVAYCGLPATAQPTWQMVTIPSLQSGSSLGKVWARTRSEAYVWANENTSGLRKASLYRWDGAEWHKVLDAPGTNAASVYGVGASEVFAASATQIWRSTNSGQAWV